MQRIIRAAKLATWTLLLCSLAASTLLCRSVTCQQREPDDQLLSRASLLQAARLGGDYLVRMQKPDGSFHYIYNPVRGVFSERQYNILRHTGSAICLLDLYDATRDQRYLGSAASAIKFLVTRVRPFEKNAAYVLDFDGKAKLGATGLALIAICKQSEAAARPADLELARRLARFIVSQQRADGGFESYWKVRGDEPSGSVSLFYPGEAMLGLLTLHRMTKEPGLLDAARRGADFLIKTQRTRGLPPDAWFIQALERLYQITPNSAYSGHAIDLAAAMIANQIGEFEEGEQDSEADLTDTRAAMVASRAEGMVAAYLLARKTGDKRADMIATHLRVSVRFQLSQQYTMANTQGAKNPAMALGGFRQGPAYGRIRIDYVQHNISALLGVARALY